jgi:DNA polymerase III subunit delta'
VSLEAARGQAKAARMLRAFLDSGRLPPAFLFTGPDGVGKSLMAVEFVCALLCKNRTAAGGCAVCPDCASIRRGIHPDVKICDALYQATFLEEEKSKQRTLRVDAIRHLRQDMSLQSMLGSWKAAIIVDAHTFEPAAANALLKILEEPPPMTLWILVTSQKERLPKTITSRCQTIAFSPLPADIAAKILEEKGLDASEARKLAALSEGSVSRALSLQEAGKTADAILSDALAGLKAADGLPRELAVARVQVEETIYALSQRLRERGRGGAFASVEKPLRKLGKLRQALASNVDPRLVMTLAADAARSTP